MVALTILAWATQVLFQQWGYGAVAPATPEIDRPVEANAPIEVESPAAIPAAATAERFIAARSGAVGVGATLQFLGEATVNGPEVRLRQVARWSNRDSAFFAPVADLVVTRIESAGPYRVIDLDAVRRTLNDAGVNPGLVKFVGPRSCKVNRADANLPPEAALGKWIDAADRTLTSTTPAAVSTPIAEPRHADRDAADTTAAAATDRTENPVRSLREVLTDELAARLNLPVAALHLRFAEKDERLLNLCEPQFRFALEPSRSRTLGDITWTVTVSAADNPAQRPQRVVIPATARVWQQQVVVKSPIPLRSTIRQQDVEERRALVEQLPTDTLLSMEQVIGQQSARALSPGTVLTGRMIEAVQLARQGQLLTVSLSQGAVRVKSVARALESGSLGQRIRARNEVTNEVYDVVLTGPQEAALGER
jgi:flagella basal body P-ring formation protein FlgA